MEQMLGAAERHGGEVVFVRLTCTTDVHEARVVAVGRHELGKLVRVEDLRWPLGRWNLMAAIPGRPALEVDNSTLPVEMAARRIAEHFALPMGGETREGARS